MKNVCLTLIYLSIFITTLSAQDPIENPQKAETLTEKSELVIDLKQQAVVQRTPTDESIPITKSGGSATQKIPNSYIVMLKEDFVTPFAKTKSTFSSRESQISAAEKHQAAAEKMIRKYATETLGLSNDEIEEIYTGAISGFSVKLKEKKAATTWLSRAKSGKNTMEVFEDMTLEVSDYQAESVINAYEPAAWAPQYADYGNWIVGGCDCNGYDNWIWVLDTGIDLNHPDLNVKTSYGKSFISSESSAEDYHGHGTHVAGIAAAKNNSFGAKGIAYNAWVVPVKVLNKYGKGSWSGLVAGLNWVYKYGRAGDVVNLSLGGSAPSNFYNFPLAHEIAIKKLAERGIYVVIAAGNDKKHAQYQTPARVNGSKIYTIAATAEEPIWYLNSFASQYSNYGKPPVDYAAPGTDIYSTYKNGGYAYKSGTSMAAPNFAGALLCGAKRRKGYRYYSVTPNSHKLFVIRPL